MIYVQFSDGSCSSIVIIFAGPQDPDNWANLGEVEEFDPRYLAFINPPVNVLALQSAKLQELTQLASAQKTALTERIGTLNDAIDMDMAIPEEEAELPARMAQLKLWKTYAVLLWRVTTQLGWPAEVTWPAQPANGMDLTVSAMSPETI